MNNKKNPLKSKTMWGALIALSSVILRSFGIDILPEDMEKLEIAAHTFVETIGLLWAMYGRYFATTELSIKEKG